MPGSEHSRARASPPSLALHHQWSSLCGAVSYDENAPDFGNCGVLLATTQDRTLLTRTTAGRAGDVKGGRYVSDVVELRVVRVG